MQIHVNAHASKLLCMMHLLLAFGSACDSSALDWRQCSGGSILKQGMLWTFFCAKWCFSSNLSHSRSFNPILFYPMLFPSFILGLGVVHRSLPSPKPERNPYAGTREPWNLWLGWKARLILLFLIHPSIHLSIYLCIYLSLSVFFTWPDRSSLEAMQRLKHQRRWNLWTPSRCQNVPNQWGLPVYQAYQIYRTPNGHVNMEKLW